MDTKRFFESEYINVEAVKKAQKKQGIILNAGSSENTQYGDRFVINVQFDGQIKKYAPNKASWLNIVDKWGAVSDNWVEKHLRFAVEIDRKNNRERVIAYPVEFEQVQTENIGIKEP